LPLEKAAPSGAAFFVVVNLWERWCAGMKMMK
jgi:hypothetical protein